MIPDFECMDQGDYMCSAKCNNQPVNGLLYSVRVSDDSCTPRLSDAVAGYQFVEGVKGQQLILNCEIVYSQGDKYATWLHSQWLRGKVGGYPRPSSHLFLCDDWNHCDKNYKCSFSHYDYIKLSNLTIEDLREEHAGWYTCAASDLYMSPEAYIYYYVTVSDAIYIAKGEVHTSIGLGFVS